MNLSVDYSFSLEYHAHNYAFFLAIVEVYFAVPFDGSLLSVWQNALSRALQFINQ